MAIPVDDGLIASDNKEDINQVLNFLQCQFEMKSMNAGRLIGLEINQQADVPIWVHQTAYAKKVLSSFKEMTKF